MAKLASHLWPLTERAIPWLVLALLMLFTSAFFLQLPYAGFMWNHSDGKVFEIYLTANPDSTIQLNDQIIQIGPTVLADFRANLRQTLFDGVQTGQVVPVIVQREGRLLTIPWIFPGPNLMEVLVRLWSQWGLAYIFWVAGTLTLFFLRPKDARWRLLIAFNFLTAIWLAVGSGVSRFHVWESALVLRSAIWLCIPVYWHLHWTFPKPLGRLPSFVLWGVYLSALILGGAEWFQVLPTGAYALGFLLAVAGSVGLLGAHFIFKPEQRPDIQLLVTIGITALIPSILISLARTFSQLPPYIAGGAFLSLPALPFGYLYATYRRRLGQLELRANRLISLYLFFVLLGTILITLISLTGVGLGFPLAISFASLAVAGLTLIVTSLGFAPFQRWVEGRLLGIRLLPDALVETYAARISISFTEPNLVHLLKEEVLPSLFVRQSALLWLEERQVRVVYTQVVNENLLPQANDISFLLPWAGTYSPPGEEGPLASPWPWVRLVLTLSIEKKTVGLWLLGRRDPDDYYSQREIDMLQSLANQTAMALTNIVQSERLSAFYQKDIEQHETQRTHLAHELHDHILNELARFKTSVDEHLAPPNFFETCDNLISRLRQTIKDLRPDMLNYGLHPALITLADELSRRSEDSPSVLLEVASDGTSYDLNMELHLFRIVQQACENALKHAHPKTLAIRGKLESNLIELCVEDDGCGFETGTKLNLARLVTERHFGLAGMFERAALINAQFQIDSAPGQGTRVQLTCYLTT